MSKEVFSGNFTQQEPLSEEAISAAVAVMRTGRLHRYNLTDGELGEVAALEREYAHWQGAKFCLAVASGGQAMQIAMRAAGVGAGDRVLTNAFTLAPVPGAIQVVGAEAVLVEIDQNLRLDLDDLACKASNSEAKFLLLSHMRGHLCDMHRLQDIARQYGITVIEDCAHTMGATWDGERAGNFGLAGCFSSQTYKHINSGEGGLLTSDDPEFMARAIILSGSYMLYDRHGAAPDPSYFANARLDLPNGSARMDALRAAVLRPQMRDLDAQVERWNRLYCAAADALSSSNQIVLPIRPAPEKMVGSSIQFRVPSLNEEGCEAFLGNTLKRGVEIKWFGRRDPAGFTSAHGSWRYIEPQPLPQTDGILAQLFDMRLPLTFTEADCQLIGRIVVEEAETVT